MVAYDIRSPKRLYRVHRILKDYASGGQKSAFECYLSKTEQQELLNRINETIENETDAFLMIRLMSRDSVATLGKAVKPLDQLYTYLG